MSDKDNKIALQDLESARMDAMKLRFRRVVGEGVASHNVRDARKKIAQCAIVVHNLKRGSKNA